MERDPPSPDSGTVNAALVNTFADSAIANAILAQHTLYAYHFARGGSALNELGLRDLDILAAHFKENPGELNVRPGDASASLYEARVNEVRNTLAKAGVARDRVTLARGLPGGDGMPAEQVIRILAQDRKAEGPRAYIALPSTSGASGSTP
jgi:hypothetical protein